MIQFTTLKNTVIISACLLTTTIFTEAFAQSAPSEKLTEQIQRTQTSPQQMNAVLTKNLFKSETYQAHYTEQVPYQDTETYTVQIPYQTTETYTENVPYTVSTPYTDYETDYRNEYKCEDVRSEREECSNERQCYLVPGSGSSEQCENVEECGTNAQGDRICKVRRVCQSGSAPEERCEYKNVCHMVDSTRRECNYVQVPYTREVTKYRDETRYRQETRTRNVTKYRDETRTRQITKYRAEDRCCVTQTRNVFDQQISFNVTVVFPATAILLPNQSELVNVVLVSGDLTSAEVRIQSINSIYNYGILKQTSTGSSIIVELEIKPRSNLLNADIPELTDSKKISADLILTGIDSSLIIHDATFDFSDVSTTYDIYLDLMTAAGSKPLNMKSFKRSEIQLKNMTVKLSDIIGYDSVSKNALKPGQIIEYSFSAKRTGSANSLLSGKTVKAAKSGRIQIL